MSEVEHDEDADGYEEEEEEEQPKGRASPCPNLPYSVERR